LQSFASKTANVVRMQTEADWSSTVLRHFSDGFHACALCQTRSMTAGYYRKRHAHFRATDNQDVTPEDYDPTAVRC